MYIYVTEVLYLILEELYTNNTTPIIHIFVPHIHPLMVKETLRH